MKFHEKAAMFALLLLSPVLNTSSISNIAHAGGFTYKVCWHVHVPTQERLGLGIIDGHKECEVEFASEIEAHHLGPWRNKSHDPEHCVVQTEVMYEDTNI